MTTKGQMSPSRQTVGESKARQTCLPPSSALGDCGANPDTIHTPAEDIDATGNKHGSTADPTFLVQLFALRNQSCKYSVSHFSHAELFSSPAAPLSG